MLGLVTDSCPGILQVVMLILILIFAGVHSGLASFRNTGEKLIGERPFRVLFAGISLPLAVSIIVSYCSVFPLITDVHIFLLI